MSDETIIDAAMLPALKSVASVVAGVETPKVEPDKARGRRGPAPTVLLARTGLAVANGADSMGGAMIEAGYSPNTAKNPTANGVTMPRALAAAAEVFPEAPTLRTLKAKSLHAINAAFDDDDLPSLAKAQLGGNVVKLAAEIGEGDDATEATRSAAYYRRQARRAALHAWMQGARFGVQHGIEAALEHAVGLSERTDERVPYFDSILPPRGNVGLLQTVFQRKGQ